MVAVMVTLWDAVRCAGPSGPAVVAVTPLLLVAGVLVLALARGRGPVLVFCLLALLPLGLGLVGTVAGLMEVYETAVAAGEMADPAIMAEGLRRSCFSALLGAGASAPLVALGLVGLVVKGRRARAA